MNDDDLYECESCSAKPGSPTLCWRCATKRAHAGDRWRGQRPVTARGLWSDRHGAKIDFQVSTGSPVRVRAMEITPKPDLTRRHQTRMATLRKTAARLVREVIEAGPFGFSTPPLGWSVNRSHDRRDEVISFRVNGPRGVWDGGEIRHGTRLDHVRDLTPPGLTILADDQSGEEFER